MKVINVRGIGSSKKGLGVRAEAERKSRRSQYHFLDAKFGLNRLGAQNTWRETHHRNSMASKRQGLGVGRDSADAPIHCFCPVAKGDMNYMHEATAR